MLVNFHQVSHSLRRGDLGGGKNGWGDDCRVLGDECVVLGGERKARGECGVLSDQSGPSSWRKTLETEYSFMLRFIDGKRLA